MSTEPIAAAIERLQRSGTGGEHARADEMTAPAGGVSRSASGGHGQVAPTVPAPDAGTRAPSDEPPQAADGWTIDAVRRLGTTTDVPTAAKILGIGRTLAFRLVRTDAFPVRIVRAGTRITVPVPELLRALGASVEGEDRR